MTQPLTREEIDMMIARDLEEADDAVQAAWEAMRVESQKWRCSPWGDSSAGFWVVAERDGNVVWYNDIEEGFNTSPFTEHGTIDVYSCNQSSFAEFLSDLPEAKDGEKWAAAREDLAVPLALENGGRIVARQTTYWTLNAGGDTWRVHFRDKAEAWFESAQYSGIEISDSHPILAYHNENWVQLFEQSRPMMPPHSCERWKKVCSGVRRVGAALPSTSTSRKSSLLVMVF